VKSTQEGVDTLNDLAGATTPIGIGEVLRCLMAEFGGPVGFAKEVKTDFDANKNGSANRIRIESDILRSLQNFGADDDEGSDDIEDVENQVRQLLAEEAHDDGA